MNKRVRNSNRVVRSTLVVAACSAALIAGGQAAADAAVSSPAIGDPIGEPLTIVIDNAAQSAIVTGSSVVASGAYCLAKRGRKCTLTNALGAAAGSYIGSKVQCPNGGVRNVSIQGFEGRPTQSNPEGTQFKVVGNACAPS